MDGETYLSWNVTNWITVVLMVVVGMAAVTLLSQGVKKLAAGGIGPIGGMSNKPQV